MQTVEVLANDEDWTENHEDYASLAIYILISSVDCKENHVSKIVEAV